MMPAAHRRDVLQCLRSEVVEVIQGNDEIQMSQFYSCIHHSTAPRSSRCSSRVATN